MTSEYLQMPLRTLREAYDDLALLVLDREQRQEGLLLRKADLESRFDADKLGEQIDAISDELEPLLDRLDWLEEEIAWRERAEERQASPIVL